MKRSIGKIIALMLTLAMCLSMGITALAAGNVLESDGGENVKASITKELDIPANVTCPNETFAFVFEQDTTTGGTFETNAATIPNATSAFTNADKPTNGKIVKSTGDIFANASFPNAGIYRFTVKEITGNTQYMTYSDAEYTLEVGIVNGEDGNLIIDYVKVTDGDGSKVDPTYEERTTLVDGTEGNMNATGNGFRFVNVYEKMSGGEENAALTISKTVAGNMGNKTNLYFSFKLTLTADSNAPADGRTYTYKIGETTGEITTGVEKEFQLKHGENLVIEELYAGTQFIVEEEGTALYQAKVNVTNASVNGETSGAENGDGVVTTIAFIDENGGSRADFTNTRDDVTPPEGIIIDSLPYIALIAVAAAGILLVVLGKKRREQKN